MTSGKSSAVAAFFIGLFTIGYYFGSGCLALRSPIGKICTEPDALGGVLTVETICFLVYGSFYFGKWKKSKQAQNKEPPRNP